MSPGRRRTGHAIARAREMRHGLPTPRHVLVSLIVRVLLAARLARRHGEPWSASHFLPGLGYLTGVSCVPTAEEFAGGPEVTRISNTTTHALARARRAHTRFGSHDRLAASSGEETHWF
jgi:hypothetical protein